MIFTNETRDAFVEWFSGNCITQTGSHDVGLEGRTIIVYDRPEDLGRASLMASFHANGLAVYADPKLHNYLETVGKSIIYVDPYAHARILRRIDRMTCSESAGLVYGGCTALNDGFDEKGYENGVSIFDKCPSFDEFRDFLGTP